MSHPDTPREIMARLRDGSLPRHLGVPLLREALAKDPGAIRRAVEALLVPIVARHTDTPEDRVRSDAPLDRYGFDSVMALGVVRDLTDVFGPLPPSLLFEVRSVRDLADRLATQYPEAARRLAASPGAEAPTVRVPSAARPPAAGSGAARTREDIAVVGLSGRFPMADTVDEFWANLEAGRDCIEEVPANRWDHDRIFDPVPGTPGRAYSRWGGFIRDVDRFDHGFFRISPRQAVYMDPQERLLLQEVWHACEDAGIPPSRLAGRAVGVYAGVMYSQYELWGMGADAYQTSYLGSSYASIVNRVSHFYDLRGPSVALDTMCSSSLVALDLAVEALRSGSIETAVVAGVNLTVHPKKHVDLSQGRFASTDGRCRSFGAGGDGYVPGEAVVAAVLTRRDAAESAGLPVWGLIRGTAVSHGGRTNGYTTPNPHDQADVMRAAMRDAGVAPAALAYVEAHGTGTSLGDSIEMRSLAEVLAGTPERPRTAPCAVGSVKSNVGHCEAAAGLVGLGKTLLQLHHRKLVPSLHATTINPDLGVPEDLIRVQRDARAWPTEGARPAIAGVSSFGAGGTNAHVVLEGAPRDDAARPGPPARGFVLPLSAQTPESLRGACEALASHLREHRPRLDDVERTLVDGREHLEVRRAVLAATVDEAVERLGAAAREDAGTVVGDGDDASTTWAKAWAAASDPRAAVPWPSTGRLVRLPGYVFARDRHWPVDDGPAEVVRTVTVTSATSVNADHVVQGRCVMAGSSVIELVFETAGADTAIASCAWTAPLTVPEDGVAVQVAISGNREDTRTFAVRAPDSGRTFCEGELVPAAAALGTRELPPADWPGATEVDPGSAYAHFAALGLRHGPSLKVLTSLRVRGDEAVAGLAPVAEHPVAVLVDAALQCLVGFAMDEDALLLPFSMNRVDLRPGLADARWAHAARRGAVYDIDLVGAAGDVLGRLEGVAMLPAAPGSRGRSGDAAPVASPPQTGSARLHRIGWDLAPSARADKADEQPGCVVLAGADDDLAAGIAAAMRARGWTGRVATLEGPEIDPSAAGGEAAGTTVVLLGACRPPASDEAPADATAREVGRGLHDVRDHAVRAGARTAGPVTIVDVRSGDDPDAESGLAAIRVLATEDSRYRGSALIVEGGLGEVGGDSWCDAVADHVLRGTARITAVQAGPDGLQERVLAVRADGFRGSAGAQGVTLRREGVYLLVGGRGGVGRELAKQLARRVAARLVIAGRRAPDDGTLRLLDELRSSGGDAEYVQADCSTREGARAAVAAAQSRFGRLDGVVHLAGVLRDATATRKTRAAMDEVVAAKAWSAVRVDEATADLPLDFWLSFGSASSYVGVPGQIDYAWANRHLVALARRRERARREGRRSGPTAVVSWPLLESEGMGVDAAAADRLRTHLGWQPLPASDMLAVAEEALHDGEVEALPVYGDRSTIERWLRDDWGTAHAAAPATRAQAGPVPQRVVDRVRALVAGELGMDPGALDPRTSFDRVGLESVMVINLGRALSDLVGPVSTTVFFEHRTVAELAAALWDAHEDGFREALGLRDRPPAARGSEEPAAVEAVAPERAAPTTASESAGTAVTDEAVAIVGLSGVYPGADGVAEFWERLAAGEDCVSEVPPERWNHAELFDPQAGLPGRTYAKWGGFLRDPGAFDARFFGISRAEAVQLDPQERIFLQVAWHAIEDAGYTPQHLAGGTVGVFAGVMYAQYQMYGADPELQRRGLLPNSQSATVANRVSYCLDLRGPSLSVDTMCSSSLTAVHLACAAIRSGDCDTALAGGVNVISHPYRYLQLAQGRFASSEGRCRSFGAGGDGYVPGEGAGVVVLKRLSAARADGDHVYGVIRGSAVNHGGRTNGFTVPSVTAQAAVVRSALERSGVDAEAVDYVEAHGTGTALGDPIEVAALNSVLSGSGPSCPIGSVKSNIGHLESAAGIAALTKVLLQMRHGELVPSLHSKPANPEVDLRAVHVQDGRTAWRRRSGRPGPLVAAVSSFGAGGSNGHLIVEAPASPHGTTAHPAGPHVVRLSARSPEALRHAATRLADHLDTGSGAGESADRFQRLAAATAAVLGLPLTDIDPAAEPLDLGIDPISAMQIAARLVPADESDRLAGAIATARSLREAAALLPVTDRSAAGTDLADIAFTLAEGRVAFDERLALVCEDVSDLLAGLREFAATGATAIGVRGSREDRGGGLGGLFGGESGARFVAGLQQEGRWRDLAELWARGFDTPSPSDVSGSRIPLPGYPFETEHLWVPVGGEPAREPEAAPPARSRAAARPTEPAEVVEEPSSRLPAAEAPAAPPVPEEQRLERAVSAVRAAMGGVLDAEPESLGLDVPHAEFGVDSVFAVAIVDRINQALGTDLGPTDFFRFTTVRALADHLATLPIEDGSTGVPSEPSAADADTAPQVRREDPAATPAHHGRPDADDTAVAVIGVAGRFPRAADVEAFWENLRSGVDAVDEIPLCRWDTALHFDPDRSVPRKTYGKWGSVLEDPAAFDAEFFGLSPREAQLMDPQHRLFLETAWHAMEDAGIPAEELRGADVGVYVGASAGDYQNYLRDNDVDPEGYTFTGNHPAMLPSRLAYHLDLRGPTMAVDTSCSSSLMAVHLACEAIRTGRTEAAFAGGVALLFTSELHLLASKAGMLSATGRCRAFDQGADGFVPGEAVGVVLLKRLSSALADGDRILGVVRGSGANQDGRSNGITAPNMTAQRDLEVEVYNRFGIDPDQIGYVETHGTGTRLGDPIEIEALSEAFSPFTDRRGFCAVGSVKSNVGHTLTAAGITGFIKALLTLDRREIPPTLHVEQANPHLRLDGSPFRIATERQPFDAPPGGVRHAAVSSFGFSGTNTHVVLAEAPATAEPPRPAAAARPLLLPVSARTAAALERRIRDLASWLSDGDDLEAIARTLARRRTHLRHRAIFAATGTAEFLGQLSAWTPGQDQAAVTGDLAPTAADYLAGKDVDWAAVYPGASAPVALPAYPFAPVRHWPAGLEPPVVHPDGTAAPGTAAPEPRRDPATGATARIALDPRDPLVADHVVDGHPMLPAAGHLSLLVDLVQEAWGSPVCTVRHAVWLTPVLVDEPLDLRVSLEPGEDFWRWEIASVGDGEPVVHSRGRVRPGAERPAPAVPLSSFEPASARAPETLYYEFLSIGVRYGPAFRSVQEYWVEDGDVVARLERPEGDVRCVSAGVLDGVVQSMLAVPGDDPAGVDLPFAMNEIRILGRTPDRAVSVVRQLRDDECSLTLASTAGEPCIVVDSLMFRTVPERTAMHHLVPQWTELAGEPARPAAGPVLVVAGRNWSPVVERLRERHGADVDVLDWDDPSLEDLVRVLEEERDLGTVYLCGAHPDDPAPEGLGSAEPTGRRALAVIRRLAAGRHASRPLDLVALTVDGRQRHDTDPVTPANAIFFGLLRSVAREHPSWSVRCLDLSSEEMRGGGAAAHAAQALDLPAHGLGSEAVLRSGRGWAPVLVEVPRPERTAPPYRHQGVYLVLGGAGGVGFATAMHLAKTVQARVVLLGRRAPDDQIRAKLALLRQAGGEAAYIPVDATDAARMREAVREAAGRFGPIRGAFHSALALRDRMVHSMTDEDFTSAVAPKTAGAENLVAALDGQPLDLLVFYSSAQSFFGGAGQANYAAASTCLDAYAGMLRAQGLPASVVNWGYWGDIGVVSGPRYREAMSEQGIGSITPTAGMSSLDAIVSGADGQTLAIDATDDGLSLLLPGRREPEAPEGIGGFLRDHAAMERLGLVYALSQFADIGLVDRHGAVAPAPAWEPTGLDARYHRLAAAVLDHAERVGLLAGVEPHRRLTAPPAPPAAARAALAEYAGGHPALGARIELLLTCLDAYPSVLTGRRPATSVVFPGASAHLVEAVYRGDPLTEALNALVAEAVESEIEAGAGPLRILEVGAGTGGTTRAVAPVLRRHEGRAAYVYSDVAAGFLQHGRSALAGVGAAEFRRLDVERPAEEQDVPPESIDVVVASNVLHATADLAATLRNVAGMLRPGGSLVLLETTSVSGLATMTFGLLDGWWAFTDDVREPGSPLASVATWTALLREQGFGSPAVREPAPGGVGQHVIIARRISEEDGSGDGPAPAAGRDREAVAEAVVAAVAQTLRCDPASIEDEVPFTEFGVDSIVLVDLVGALNDRLGLELKPTVLFDYPTVADLVGYLMDLAPEPLDAAPEGDADAEEDPLALLARGMATVEETMARLRLKSNLEDRS